MYQFGNYIHQNMLHYLDICHLASNKPSRHRQEYEPSTLIQIDDFTSPHNVGISVHSSKSEMEHNQTIIIKWNGFAQVNFLNASKTRKGVQF